MLFKTEVSLFQILQNFKQFKWWKFWTNTSSKETTYDGAHAPPATTFLQGLQFQIPTQDRFIVSWYKQQTKHLKLSLQVKFVITM